LRRLTHVSSTAIPSTAAFVIPLESVENIFRHFSTGDQVEIDLSSNKVTNATTGRSFELRPLGDAADIINAGGLFAYARKIGMIKSNTPPVGQKAKANV